jgi:hypothetical protein
MFAAVQNRGWDYGASHREGLSRVIAARVVGNRRAISDYAADV